MAAFAPKLCVFEVVDGVAVCTECGRRVTVFGDVSTIYSQCGQAQPQPQPGLGDYVEGLLQSVGITKERYKAAKELFGLPPNCSCDSRREWLNRVSDWWRGTSSRS